MSRLKATYISEVHLPETESERLELRKQMGTAYIDFVKNYIKALSISDDKKNKLYLDVNNKLIENTKKCKNDMI